MELISIIVPVYNSEKYIKECVDSILEQTYNNIELILVDDGSMDNAGHICDEYTERDSRVRVIHQKNRGVSAARNIGLDIARGEYIGFVDSDDIIKPNMYETLHNALKANSSDMVLCNYCKISENGEFGHERIYIKNETVSGIEACKWLGKEHDWSYVLVTNRLYKKSLFQNLRFKENRIHEDEFIAHELYIRCNRVTGVEDSLYFYRRNSNSITSVKGIKHLDGVEACYERFLAYQRQGLDDQLLIALNNAKGQMREIKYIKFTTKEERKRRAEIVAMFRYMVCKLKFQAGIKNILIAICPTAYFRVQYLVCEFRNK